MGSLLQAYALKKIIESMECQVEFVEINKEDEEKDLLEESSNILVEENNRKKKTRRKRNVDKYIINRIKNKNELKKQFEKYDEFRKVFLEISDSRKNKTYDVCIIGSDEVFNCQEKSEWGFSSQLFGNIDNARKVITYAASCGFTKYDNLPNNVKEKIEKNFKNISSFSVRDENTYLFVKKLTNNNNISYNLDPAIIYDFEKEINNVLVINRSYCIVYSYYNRISDKEEINAIKRFCHKEGLHLIALGAPQYWIKDFIPCSPFECLSLFQNSSFVITDTFHGTICAAKYSNRFGYIVRESNKNKLEDLSNRLGITNHHIVSMDEIEKIYSCNNTGIDKIIELENMRTINYLRNNI